MRTEDGHIIYKCLNGEPEAFGFLVDKYRESVYAFAYSKLRNFEDAEDVTQEVFFKAYQKLRTLKRWDSFLGWLYSITSNLCKNWARSRSRRPDSEFMADKDPGTLEIPSIDAYRERLERESLRESLDEALNILPETYRLVLTLHYLGGLSNREIARFLGTSPAAVKQRLMRARGQMKEEMLAMMSETYKEQKLPVGFTFHIVEAVKRMKIQPVPRTAGLPWGLSLATGIIIAILSIGSYLNLPNLILPPMSSAHTGQVEMAEVGEMPVEMLRISRIPVSFGKQGNSYSGGPQLPDQQNAVLLAPRGEGDEWPEEPTARLGRGSVKQIAYSPDGKLLAAVGTRGISLYDADNLNEVGILGGHTGNLISVAFSPDGKWLASGGYGDKIVLLWEMNIPVPGKSVEPTGKLPGTWGGVKRTELFQNFPNPFNPETWIPYSLSNPEHVTIRIYTSTGQLVRTLDLGQKPSGAYLSKEKAAYWDGKNEAGEIVASNIYFYVMEAGETTDSRKMVVAR